MAERDRFDEIKDHVNVVFESLRGDIRLLAEGHGSLAGGQLALREEVELLRVGQEGLHTGQEALRGELALFRGEVREEFRAVRVALHSSHSALDERVGRVERDVVTLKRQVRTLGPKRGRS